MRGIDRSGVIRLAEAQAGIPGLGGEHSVSLLRRGTLDVKLSLPVSPNQQTPHAQDEIYVVIRAEASWFTAANGTYLSQAIFCLWLREPSILSRTLPRISRCGLSSTAPVAARFQLKALPDYRAAT